MPFPPYHIRIRKDPPLGDDDSPGAIQFLSSSSKPLYSTFDSVVRHENGVSRPQRLWRTPWKPRITARMRRCGWTIGGPSNNYYQLNPPVRHLSLRCAIFSSPLLNLDMCHSGSNGTTTLKLIVDQKTAPVRMPTLTMGWSFWGATDGDIDPATSSEAHAAPVAGS